MRNSHPTVKPLLPLLVAAVVVLLSSRPAVAQVVVAVGGDADQSTRTKMSEAISDALREQRAEVSDQKVKAAEVDALIDCISDEGSQDCAAKFMDSTKASRAIVMRVVGAQSDTTTIYGWVVATAGTVLVVNQRVCEKCSTKQLVTSARALLTTLLKDVETRTLPTKLAVRSTPPGAQVEIDGRIIGVTPLEHGVYAGQHRIRLHLRGYETSIQEREALAGETTVVDVELTASAAPADPPPDDAAKKGAGTDKRPLRWKPWTVIGAGALIAAGGIVLVAADEEGGGEGVLRYEHRETKALGIGGIGVGVAVVAAGVFWLVRDGRAREPKQPGPTVTVDHDRILFGYGGAF